MQLIAEVTYDDINLCMADGSEITDSGLLQDLADCCASGDVEPACQYFINHYDIKWIKVINISRNPLKSEKLPATDDDITSSAKCIYFDSDSDFTDMDLAKWYLIWQAASDIIENQNEE